MSVLAGLGGVVIEVVLLGGFYLFDFAARTIVEKYSFYCLGSALITFVAGFGISLQFALTTQFRRGKWK
jgi:hypothetical protein